MTDIWDSARGSDIWELVEYPDPSSVQYSTMSPFQGQPENNSILISSTNSDTAVSTASFSTWDPDVLANDCTDSDISSDHEMHSNSGNDDDSDWEDVTEDSGYCRFQSADPVAEMLDSVVQSGVLPREHIFYKLVSGALEYVSYDHSKEEKYRWDPTLVCWARSLLRLGKSRTFNFCSRTWWFQCRQGQKNTHVKQTHRFQQIWNSFAEQTNIALQQTWLYYSKWHY